MNFKYPLAFIFSLFLLSGPSNAQVPAQAPATKAVATVDDAIDRVIAQENELVRTLSNYTPMMETYIQTLEADQELGAVPKSDKYFLGKLDFKKGINTNSLLPAPGFGGSLQNMFKELYSVRYLPKGFAEMILIDAGSFNRNNYDFEFVRREFLGEVKCIVFDVQPKPKAGKARFTGRLWVEDQGYNVVRFNGLFNGTSSTKMYFHFDSWREQMGPGLWLPAYVYSEESDMGYFLGRRHLNFKGQTRLWGYNIGRAARQNEFTSMIVEADKVEDNAAAIDHMSPVLSYRLWERQAEDNILDRMQKAGVLAPEGDVEKVLETVVTNLEVTNNLTIEPETRVRVLLTAPLETFSVGHTIVLSRGLIDVLPDEASLAMVLAHELAHMSLGHRLDTKYAFSDRMIFDDTRMFTRLSLQRDEKEEQAADLKAMEFLQNSPYKDKLGAAGLFLRALDHRAQQLTNLLTPHVGNRMAENKNVKRMADLMESAPELMMGKVDQIAALPLGGRLGVDPWSNQLRLLKTKPVSLLSAREKLQFEITPVFLYLTRQKEPTTSASRNNN